MFSVQGGAQEHGRSPRGIGQVADGGAERGGDPARARGCLQGASEETRHLEEELQAADEPQRPPVPPVLMETILGVSRDGQILTFSTL